MLPLRVDLAYERRPWATLALAALNVTVFAGTASLSLRGLRPWLLDPDAFAAWQLLTSAFLHADVFHLAANVVFLLVFGRYVEERTGPWRFLALYLASALLGSVAYLAACALEGSDVPALGASGAVAGTMGFLLASAPRSRIVVFWFPDRAGRLPRVPAWVYLGLWLLLQAPALLGSPYYGLAYAIHLGGFLAGVGASLLLHSRLLAGSPWHLERELEGGDPAAAARRRRAAILGAVAAYVREKRGGVRVRHVPPPRASDGEAPGPRAPVPGPRPRAPLAPPEPEPEPEAELLPPRPGDWTVLEGVRDLATTLAGRLLYAIPLAIVVYGFLLSPLLSLPRSYLLTAIFGVPLGMGVGAVVARRATGSSGFVGWVPAAMALGAAGLALLVGYVVGTAINPIPEAEDAALAVTMTVIGVVAAVYWFLVADA